MQSHYQGHMNTSYGDIASDEASLNTYGKAWAKSQNIGSNAGFNQRQMPDTFVVKGSGVPMLNSLQKKPQNQVG